MLIARQRYFHASRIFLRCYSTPAPSTISSPPLLLKIREDLKTAMRAKDSLRLDVLRSLIAETTNAAKTSNPVNSDLRMLALIRKAMNSSVNAASEFEQAGRTDLQEKERAQLSVLEGYVKSSGMMDEAELQRIVQDHMEKMKTEGQRLDKGTAMKALVGPGGALEGQLVDKKDVAKVVDRCL